jgi:hypothetical protein
MFLSHTLETLPVCELLDGLDGIKHRSTSFDEHDELGRRVSFGSNDTGSDDSTFVNSLNSVEGRTIVLDSLTLNPRVVKCSV